MTRFSRCKILGEKYSEDAIKERTRNEDILFYKLSDNGQFEQFMDKIAAEMKH